MQPGEKIPVGTVLAMLLEPGEVGARAPRRRCLPQGPPQRCRVPAAMHRLRCAAMRRARRRRAPRDGSGRRFATGGRGNGGRVAPAGFARRRASARRELDIDPEAVPGTGPARLGDDRRRRGGRACARRTAAGSAVCRAGPGRRVRDAACYNRRACARRTGDRRIGDRRRCHGGGRGRRAPAGDAQGDRRGDEPLQARDPALLPVGVDPDGGGAGLAAAAQRGPADHRADPAGGDAAQGGGLALRADARTQRPVPRRPVPAERGRARRRGDLAARGRPGRARHPRRRRQAARRS